jgi:putative FmdB family regulatory protein
MPLFEYKCDYCGAISERIDSYDKADLCYTCRSCWQGLLRQLSTDGYNLPKESDLLDADGMTNPFRKKDSRWWWFPNWFLRKKPEKKQ